VAEMCHYVGSFLFLFFCIDESPRHAAVLYHCSRLTELEDVD
jgi:hypothetical protein